MHRVQTSIARSATTHESVWPGEYFEAFCDIDPHEDAIVAVGPHMSSSFPIAPMVTTSLKGSLRFLNTSTLPVKVRKNQHIAHIIRAVCPEEIPACNVPSSVPAEHSKESNISKIEINPDKSAEFVDWEHKYEALHNDFAHVFSDQFPGYNGRAGPIKAVVNTSNSLPPQ